MKKSRIHGNWMVLILHIAAWILLFAVPIYLFSLDTNPDEFFRVRVFSRTFIFVLIFYINYFLLVPRLLFKQKRVGYYVAATALVLSLYFVNHKINDFVSNRPKYRTEREKMDKLSKELKFIPKHPWRFDLYNFIFTSVLISGFSIGLRMTARYYENERQRKELEKEKLNSELAFLKNQISPHFFFNTLNNIYSLVEINTSDAQKAILQLSKLMRYMLYESEQGNTQLGTEVEFMRNYIELMKLRLTDKVELNVSFPAKIADVKVPPLLFIPFIENAFKHGISYRDASFINIALKLNDKKIEFVCENSMGAPREKEFKESSGIGLENVKKRLKLLFPDKHNLQIIQNEDSFSVNLRIDFT